MGASPSPYLLAIRHLRFFEAEGVCLYITCLDAPVLGLQSSFHRLRPNPFLNGDCGTRHRC
jgi:hypothetical protein